jgi:hypothetical protein
VATFTRRIPRKRRRQAESGVALILVMLFLGLMLLLGLAATMTSITEVNANGNLRLQTDAFNVADAGAVHAYELVRQMQGDFTCLIRGVNTGTIHDGDEFENRSFQIYASDGTITRQGTSSELMWKTSPARATPITHTLCADGVNRALVQLDSTHYYELIVYDNARDANSWMADSPRELNLTPVGQSSATAITIDTDQRVLVRSIGYVLPTATTPSNFDPRNAISTAVVDQVIGLTPYPAVISNDDLTITNSSSVTGELGGVHANDDLVLGSGSFHIDQTATWANGSADSPPSGSNSTVDNTHVDGFNGQSGTINIPDLNPYTYADQLDYFVIAFGTSQNERDALTNKLGGNAASLISGDTTRANTYVLHKTAAATYEISAQSTGQMNSTTIGGYDIRVANNGNANVDTVAATAAAGKGWFFLLAASAGTQIVEINGGTNGFISLFTNANVHLNGNSNLNPAIKLVTPENPPWDTIDILVDAGQDVTMSGSASATDWIEGVIYAHEQFDMTGSGNLRGQVVGYERAITIGGSPVVASTNPNSLGVSTYVASGASRLSGNFEIEHSDARGYIGNFNVAAWRQLHDFDPVTAARP